jgi:hypothetical protein
MAAEFNIEGRWPELFEQLDATQRRAVVQSLASAWHEGWEPNREDVENLTDRARGAIDHAEYLRRSDAAAERSRRVSAVAS